MTTSFALSARIFRTQITQINTDEKEIKICENLCESVSKDLVAAGGHVMDVREPQSNEEER